LGSEKPVDESNALPVPSAIAQVTSLAVNKAFRLPVAPLVGDMISISPRADRSRSRSRLARQSLRKPSEEVWRRTDGGTFSATAV
jgi:hypothetical protein